MNAFEKEFLTVPDNEPVKNFLNHALTAKTKGDSVQYDLIVKQLRSKDDPDTLWKVLIGLSSFASKLTQRSDLYQDLLSLIFAYDWKSEKRVNIAMINLIGHIVSNNATFLSNAFHLFVKSFLPNLTTSLASEVEDVSLEDRRACIHAAMKEILQQVPTGQSILFPILASSFPHKRFSRKVQTEYVSQLLTICEYFPTIQSKIIDLIVSKSLEMDVEIVIEDSGDVRIEAEFDTLVEDLDEADEVANGVFSFDDGGRPQTPIRLGGAGAAASGVLSSGSKMRKDSLTQDNAATSKIPSEVAEMADNLDSVLVLLVRFFDKELSASPLHQERLSHQLIAIFEQRILLTHKSKFVQYCLFFVASRCETFAAAFTRKMLAITLDIKMSNIARQSAVMYLASFVSRASFLSNELVSDTLSQLIVWASAYVLRTGGNTMIISAASVSPEATPPRKSQSAPILSLLDLAAIAASNETQYDEYGRVQVQQHAVKRHEIFFSVLQCACYILCFHGCELASTQRMSAVLRQHWECVVTSKYDPLRYCLKTVRIEFLKLAMHVGLFEDHVWEKFSPDLLHVDAQTMLYNANDANTATTRDGNSIYSGRGPNGAHSDAYYGRLGLGSNPLDTFFPFDPCLLQKLHSAIEKGYRTWQGVPGMDEEIDSDSEADEYDSEQEAEDDHLLGTPAIAIQQQKEQQHGRGASMGSSLVSSLAYTDHMSGSAMSVSNSMPGEYFLKALKNTHHPRSNSITQPAPQQHHHHQSGATPGVPSFDQWHANIDEEDELVHDEHQFQLSQENLSRVAVDVVNASTLGKSRRPRQYSIGSNSSW